MRTSHYFRMSGAVPKIVCLCLKFARSFFGCPQFGGKTVGKIHGLVMAVLSSSSTARCASSGSTICAISLMRQSITPAVWPAQRPMLSSALDCWLHWLMGRSLSDGFSHRHHRADLLGHAPALEGRTWSSWINPWGRRSHTRNLECLIRTNCDFFARPADRPTLLPHHAFGTLPDQ
jgi:hypothetical protein